MKNHKQKIILGFVLSVSILAFLYISPDPKHIERTRNTITKKTQTHNPIKNANRSPASSSKTMINKSFPVSKSIKNRTILGNIDPNRKLVFNNKIDENWEEKYRASLFKYSDPLSIKDFKITKKRSVLKVKNNAGTHMEHIVVSYTKPDGSPFSFEAMINSETGVAVQTWNKTRREFKKPMYLEATNYKFYR